MRLAINVDRKKIRQKVAGSLKTNIPTKTMPTAPMPVHTAYAVPIGNVCEALYKSAILMIRQNKNPKRYNVETIPLVSFALPRQKAKPVSNKPAIINKTQFKLRLY